MAIAIYPGSFDPITVGHLDIIERVSPLFEKLVIVVSRSTDKNYLFSDVERRDLILASLENAQNVEVQIHDGLTVDFAKTVNASVIVRGIRVVSDFEHEMVMANMNRKLLGSIETMVVFANPEYHFVASRITKEIAKYGGNLEGLVPKPVIEALTQKMKS